MLLISLSQTLPPPPPFRSPRMSEGLLYLLLTIHVFIAITPVIKEHLITIAC